MLRVRYRILCAVFRRTCMRGCTRGLICVGIGRDRCDAMRRWLCKRPCWRSCLRYLRAGFIFAFVRRSNLHGRTTWGLCLRKRCDINATLSSGHIQFAELADEQGRVRALLAR